jgi:O-antigen/teichoic acid export membrane protein
MKIFEKVVASIFIVSIVLEFFLIPYAISREYEIKNRYYNFHKRYGIIRISILKILFGVPIILLVLYPPYNAVELHWAVLTYVAYSAWLMVLIISAQPPLSSDRKLAHKNRIGGYPLDASYPCI